jgi:hypothetical protein
VIPWWTIQRLASTDGNVNNDNSKNLYMAWISRAAWVYVLMAIVNPMLPGIDWGSRYLLPALPLLILLSANALEGQYNNTHQPWKFISLCGITCLALISFGCQAVGLVGVTKSVIYDHEMIGRIATDPENVIIYSNDGVGPHASALKVKKDQFLLRCPEDWPLFMRAIHSLHRTGFAFVGTASDYKYFVSYALPEGSTPVYFKCISQKLFVPTVSNPYCPPLVFADYQILPVKGTAAQ